MSVPNIQIIPSKEIDRTLWDSCVAADPKGLIYDYTWVLDHLAEDWEGVVVNQYQAVMALPRKKKMGIEMVSMPPFVQRLGLVGSFDEETLKAVGQLVKDRVKLIHYSSADVLLFDTKSKERRTNYVMPLLESYEEIAGRCTAPCKKNLGKALKRGCVLAEDVSVKDVIKLYTEVYGSLAAYTSKHFTLLEKLLEDALVRQQCHVFGVRNKESKALVYAGLLLDDGNRLYYLLGAPNKEGREMRATYFFIDEMIHRFCGVRKTFDFEGSDIPDVATFYQSFSPQTEYYYQFYINQYSNPLKKLIDLKMGK